MRARLEFTFHVLAAGDDPVVDPTLALMGSQGWEMRGIAARSDGRLVVALQRPLGEDVALPPADTLAASLVEPLTVPDEDDLRESEVAAATG